MKHDYFVHFIKLPLKVKACTTLNTDDSFSVFVNNQYPREVQRKAVEHEIKHIKKGHFYKTSQKVRQKELEAV